MKRTRSSPASPPPLMHRTSPRPIHRISRVFWHCASPQSPGCQGPHPVVRVEDLHVPLLYAPPIKLACASPCFRVAGGGGWLVCGGGGIKRKYAGWYFRVYVCVRLLRAVGWGGGLLYGACAPQPRRPYPGGAPGEAVPEEDTQAGEACRCVAVVPRCPAMALWPMAGLIHVPRGNEGTPTDTHTQHWLRNIRSGGRLRMEPPED